MSALVCKKGVPSNQENEVGGLWIIFHLHMRFRVGMRAQSTRSIAASKASGPGAFLQEVNDAAGWSSLHTYSRFYNLDVSAFVGAQVLLPMCSFHIHRQVFENMVVWAFNSSSIAMAVKLKNAFSCHPGP